MDSQQILQFCKNVSFFVLFALCVSFVVAFCADVNHCTQATITTLAIAIFFWFAAVVPFIVVKMDDPFVKDAE